MPAGCPLDWMTTQEMADARLPGLPHTRQGVDALAAREAWKTRTNGRRKLLARPRGGRGAGLEYHVSLLPEAACVELARRQAAPPPVVPIGESDAWAEYERLSATAKARAIAALTIVQDVETLVQGGVVKTRAIETVSTQAGKSVATINNWFAAIRGVPVEDRLPHLAPGFKGGGRRAEIDEGLWQTLRSDFLRMAKPTWSDCYRRVVELAAHRGLSPPPHWRTLWRRFEATVHPEVVTVMRDGIDAVRRHLPPQERTVADLRALELVNIDGHTCDVRVQFPDGTIGRPTIIAIQDVMSRKFLAWRYAPSEDALTARGVFLDLFERYGIPNGLLSDNGRAFACKWLTGGVATRFRFKIKPDDPHGLMVMLGIKVHWALPYRGSSKPIERGFKDFCKAIARHPGFEGAYTGNNALNKPANYGSRVMDWDEFVRLWDAGIHAHNRQLGRGTETARGVDSFDQVFARSYEAGPIRKATPAHLRLAMMAGEQVRAKRDTGAVKVLGNSYWHPDLVHVAGELVTVRFDAEDATRPVDIYLADKLIATAPLWEKTGFLDAEAAKRRAKLEADHRKKTKALVEAEDLLRHDRVAAQYAELLPDYEDELPPTPTVIQPVRVRGNGGAAARKLAMQPAVTAPERAAQPQFIDSALAGFNRLKLVRDDE